MWHFDMFVTSQVKISDKKTVIDRLRVKEKNVLLFYKSTKYNNLYVMI
jgi:hypothetical protein